MLQRRKEASEKRENRKRQSTFLKPSAGASMLFGSSTTSFSLFPMIAIGFLSSHVYIERVVVAQ